MTRSYEVGVMSYGKNLAARINPPPGPSPTGRGDTTYAETCAVPRLPFRRGGEGSGVGLTRAAKFLLLLK